MQLYWNRLLDHLRDKRTKKLEPLARFLLQHQVTAPRMTLFSLLCGLLSAYFLFNNYWLFLLFGILHLIGDGLDGVLARCSKVTASGKYLDWCSDRLVALAFLVTIWFHLQDYAVLFVILLNVLTHAITFFSRFRYESVYSRTILFLALVLGLPVLGYLLAGIISLYSLLLQGSYGLRRQQRQ